MRSPWNLVVIWLLWPIWWPLAVLLLVRGMGTEWAGATTAGRHWHYARSLARVALGAE